MKALGSGWTAGEFRFEELSKRVDGIDARMIVGAGSGGPPPAAVALHLVPVDPDAGRVDMRATLPPEAVPQTLRQRDGDPLPAAAVEEEAQIIGRDDAPWTACGRF